VVFKKRRGGKPAADKDEQEMASVTTVAEVEP